MDRFAGELAVTVLERIKNGQQVQLIAPLSGVVPLYSMFMQQLGVQLPRHPELNVLDLRNNLHITWVASDKYLSGTDAQAVQIEHSPIGVSGAKPVYVALIDDVIDQNGTYGKIRSRLDPKLAGNLAPGTLVEHAAWFVGVKNPTKVAELEAQGVGVNYRMLCEDKWLNSGMGMNSGLADYQQAVNGQQALLALGIARFERLIPHVVTGEPSNPQAYLDWLSQMAQSQFTNPAVRSANSFLEQLDKTRLTAKQQEADNLLQNLILTAQLWHQAKWSKLFPVQE